MTKLGMEKEAVEPQVLYLLASSHFQKICKWASRSFSTKIYLKDPYLPGCPEWQMTN